MHLQLLPGFQSNCTEAWRSGRKSKLLVLTCSDSTAVVAANPPLRMTQQLEHQVLALHKTGTVRGMAKLCARNTQYHRSGLTKRATLGLGPGASVGKASAGFLPRRFDVRASPRAASIISLKESTAEDNSQSNMHYPKLTTECFLSLMWYQSPWHSAIA